MNQQFLILFLFLNVYSSQGTNWVDIKTKLISSDGKQGDIFGKSLAFDGVQLFVGAFGFSFENKTNCGAVYIFQLLENQWKEVKKIVSPQMEAGDMFGRSVSVSGNFAVIGAHQLNKVTPPSTGFASIFTYSSNGWNFIQSLFPPDGKPGDSFGVSVALHEKWLVVGSQVNNGGTGAVYVYTLTTNKEWVLFQKIIPFNSTDFGCSVAVGSDRIVVGAYSEGDHGAVYVYRFYGNYWVQAAKIISPDKNQSEEEFGHSIAIDGDTVIVGAPGSRMSEDSAGSVFIFNVDIRTLSWELVKELEEFELDEGEKVWRFGESVAKVGNNLAIGCYDTPGSVWLFEFKETWTPKVRWYPIDGNFSDKFGSSLAMSESSVFIGCPLDREHNRDSIGSVFIAFTKCTEKNMTTPNCNFVQQEETIQENVTVPQSVTFNFDNDVDDTPKFLRDQLYWFGVIPVVFLIAFILYFIILFVRRRKSVAVLEGQQSKNQENQAYHYSDSEESLYASSVTEDVVGSDTSDEATDSSSRDVL